jgi:hypothetical protein
MFFIDDVSFGDDNGKELDSPQAINFEPFNNINTFSNFLGEFFEYFNIFHEEIDVNISPLKYLSSQE